jgi:putative tricarboxylic transport membrane protein
MLLVLNLPLAGVWVRLLLIPRPYLYAGIMIFSLVGVWGVSTSWWDLLIMLVIGLVGYTMRVYDFPIAPALIGLILGPMAETHLRRALSISQGDPLTFLWSPLSAVLLICAAAFVLVPPIIRLLQSKESKDRATAG